MSEGWFVTGTDTGVGKTCVAEALLHAMGRKGLRAVGMKPVASGCDRTAEGLRSADAIRLRAASPIAVDYDDVNPYAFEPAIAPHIAAARAGVEPDLRVVQHHFHRLGEKADWLVVEGAGGWQVPFNRTYTLGDVARLLGLPVVLVVGVRLGCINHALLSARAIAADGSRLAGWVANCIDPAFDSAQETVEALDARLPAPRLATFPFNAGREWRQCGDTMVARLLQQTVEQGAGSA